jgi:hypothetical protein
MSTLTVVLSVVAILIVGVLIAAAIRPDAFIMQRSAGMRAPAERIFPLINDLRVHESWSPFDKPDPATTKVHSGAAQGQGAVYEWNGKGQAGSGRIAITESHPFSRIVMQLDMLKPIRASNTVVFSLEPRADATLVTWAMHGHTPYLAKILHLFFNMDRMVGREFETGLANLKAIVER